MYDSFVNVIVVVLQTMFPRLVLPTPLSCNRSSSQGIRVESAKYVKLHLRLERIVLYLKKVERKIVLSKLECDIVWTWQW